MNNSLNHAQKRPLCVVYDNYSIAFYHILEITKNLDNLVNEI